MRVGRGGQVKVELAPSHCGIESMIESRSSWEGHHSRSVDQMAARPFDAQARTDYICTNCQPFLNDVSRSAGWFVDTRITFVAPADNCSAAPVLASTASNSSATSTAGDDDMHTQDAATSAADSAFMDMS